MTIIEFLLARITEDEAYARQAIVLPVTQRMEPGSWRSPASGVVQTDDDLIPAGDARLAAHMARFNPARILDECAAKRAVIDMARKSTEFEVLAYAGREDCRFAEQRYVGDMILLRLASLYSDHPDYDQEW